MSESLTSNRIVGKSIKGATYNVAVAAATMVLGFVRSVLLMRFLSPDEFGYVSLALFFLVFLSHLSTFGLDSALIQQQWPRRETFATHLSLRIVLAFAVLLLGFLFSLLLRRVYAGQEIVVDVLLVLLLANVLAASYSTPNAVLRRELRFGAIAVLNLLSSVAMTVGAPLMAYLGAGVWSLVYEQVVGYLVRWIGLWVVLRPWKLVLGFDRGETRSLIDFGRHVLLSQFLGITLDRFDDFWAGTALGAMELGYYSRAYDIARYPARVLATPVTQVFFATYSALQEDKQALSKAFFRSSSFLVRVGFLLAVMLLAAIREFTLILLGGNWLPIVPIFRLMTVYVVLDPLYVNLSYLVIGLGRPDYLARVRLGQVVLLVAAVVMLARWWGVLGIAVAVDVTIATGVGVLLLHSKRVLGVSLTRMLGWPIVALGVSVAVGVGLERVLQASGPWRSMVAKVAGVSAVFIAVLGIAERRTLGQYAGWVQRTWAGMRLSYRGEEQA